ncbi:MAG: RidA family protein [Pseudomonadota bacterium]
MANTIEERLAGLGIELPVPPLPAANYVPFTIAGNILTISGQIPMGPNGLEFVGKLGDTADLETGQGAARLCAINILAQAKAALGDLERVKQVMKIQGFVNATPDFTDHPKVINGASDLLVEVLGDAGKHARAAVGMSSLPLGVAVEVDATIEIA